MKDLKFIFLAILLFFASNAMQAQVSVNVNVGVQPSWGPVGYSAVNYYYIPDIQTYYDVNASRFIYLYGGNWIQSSRLPLQYRNYDLNKGYKVVLNDYRGSKPYTRYKVHKQKYYKGYGKPQKSIGYNLKSQRNNKIVVDHVSKHRDAGRQEKKHGRSSGEKGNHGNKKD